MRSATMRADELADMSGPYPDHAGFDSPARYQVDPIEEILAGTHENETALRARWRRELFIAREKMRR